ncbi:MAG: pyridoxal phosphate-dependent aminotransferase family protein [Clostridia bacterium]
MDIFKKTEEKSRYDEAKEANMYPYFHQLTSGQSTQVVMDGHNTIMIGSNNYLGLTNNKEVIQAGIDALKKYGSGCSGSRFLNGTLDLHVKFERDLAKFLGKEQVVTFSTGFQSNLGIISAIAGRNDIIFCDKENHASIYDACKLSFAKMLRYEHNDMQSLEELLKNADSEKGKLIVTDGVFSMTGQICNLPQIVNLAKKYSARIMIDDSHGLGVLGEHGKGTAEHFGLENDVDIYMGTFSKSLASLGGYCACGNRVAEFIKHNSRPYIFSASMPPANVACAHTALKILIKEPERVKNLAKISDYMRKGLKANGIAIIESTTPIIPIYTYDDQKTLKCCKMLLERGIYVNPVVSPATPVGQSLLRTSYTATHTIAQMDKAITEIKNVFSLVE